MIDELREKLFFDVAVKKEFKGRIQFELSNYKKECMDLIGFHMDGKWTFDYGFGWFDFGISINFLEIWKWLTGR